MDHISELPDSIIQHILSFLPAEDAVKSSILSKRWLSLWAEVTVLRFSDSHYLELWKFLKFVTQTLKNYRGSKLEKLELNVRDNYSLRSRLDEWICFATERNVEELRVNLVCARHELPQSVYSNSLLKRLDTNVCDFKVNGSVSWPSLRVLSICDAELSDDAVAKILLGSPNLEYLKMQYIKGVNKIIVTSSNLKELVIDGWGTSKSVMEISGPGILSLSLFGYSERRFIKLINLSSLVEVNLGLRGRGYEGGILPQLHHVEKVSVSASFLKMLSLCEVLPLPSPLKCKSLIVDTSINKFDFCGIVNLLQSSPHLEKLTINLLLVGSIEFVHTKYLESMNTYVKCHQLKSVEITGFEERIVGLNAKLFSSAVEFLLKIAPALEKMVFYAQSKRTNGTHKRLPPDLSEVNNLISTYPNVAVVFKTYFR